jgi:hypothetical protein
MKNFAAIIVLMILVTGCSNQIKIYGTVKFDDGEPVTEGTVNFRAENGNTFTALIHENGKYAPGHLSDGDGIPAGKYQVWLAGTEKKVPRLSSKGNDYDLFDLIEVVHPKYTSRQPDGLTVEVNSSAARKFDITVERAPEPKSKKK